MPHARILLYKPKLILFRQDFSGPLMCQQKLGIGESRCSISLIFWQQSAYTFPMEPPCESCSEKAQGFGVWHSYIWDSPAFHINLVGFVLSFIDPLLFKFCLLG